MIVAHHGYGEEVLLYTLTGAAGAGPVLLAVWRARLGRLIARIRRR